jgi:hypothetical protein
MKVSPHLRVVLRRFERLGVAYSNFKKRHEFSERGGSGLNAYRVN